MPLLIDPAAIEAVKRSADLAAIVRAHGVELKRKGKQLVGRCPFHSPDKTPSFFVDPAKGTWKCFGACSGRGDEKSGGDAIRFVMLAGKLSFRQAFEQLGGKIESKPLPPSSKKTTAKTISNGNNGHDDLSLLGRVVDFYHRAFLQSNVADLALLGRVVDFYHRAFLQSNVAHDYLARRGIRTGDLFTAYRIGYADGSLMQKAKGSLRDGLRRLGVIGENDHELLAGCVVFPLLDPTTGVPVSLYGRAVDRDQHLYLPGARRGLMNAETLRGAEEVILTESILDGFSLIEAGVMNVLPLYGAGGFTPDHEALIAQLRPKRIALALDSDDAGRAATARLAAVLAPAFDVRVVELDRKDINEVLVRDGVHALQKLFAPAPPLASPTSPKSDQTAAEEKTAKREVTAAGNELRYVSGDRIYQVRGIEAKGRASLRVGLKLTVGEQRVIDAIDLYSARSRNGFLSRVSEAGLADRIEVERDLLRLLDEIERMSETKNEPPRAPVLTMTESDRREALELLRRPDLLDVIARDMERIGYVGEVVNKKIGYLVAVSRKLENPMSMVVMSQSGSGKSALADALELLMPPEETILFSRLTPQALYYMDHDALCRKFIVIEERAGSAEADYSIRTLQSKKKLILAVPIKDPATGRIKTQVFEILGPAAFLETTTESRIHHENSTRCFETYCDETPEQTRRIHEMQRRSKTIEGRAEQPAVDALVRRHRNAQRLLDPLAVVIPFADMLRFPYQWLRTRRDNLRFLNLIEAVAFLHQHQRERKRSADGTPYIEATIVDYEAAYALAADLLGQTLVDLKRPATELLAVIKTLVTRKADSGVTRREIREASGLPDHRVIALLHELVQLEYVEVLSGSMGKTFRYRVTATASPAAQPIPGLMSPAELRTALRQAKETNLVSAPARLPQGAQPARKQRATSSSPQP